LTDHKKSHTCTRKLEEFRIKKGLNLRELSALSGIGYHTIVKVAAGKRNASPNVTLKICEALGIQFDELFEFAERGK
jgi:DNA-binding XRE family transcriptional regulator